MVTGNESLTQSLLDSMNKHTSRYGTVDLQGLIGAPPVFSDLADHKTDQNPYGGEYMERFITEGNFVAFTCGKAKLLPGGKKADRQNFIKHLNSQGNEEEMSKILDDYKYERLFGFKNTMAEYWQYVNILSGVSAKLMGVDTMARDIFPNKSHFSEVHWGQYKSKFIQNSMSKQVAGEGDSGIAWQYVPFYNDGIVEASEIMGNMVGQSSVESMMNNIPGKQQLSEISFLTGSDVDREVAERLNTESMNESMDGGVMGSSGLGGILKGSISTLGVTVELPDIWKGSSYDKTYNVKLKFSTPHGDPLSVYLNIIVPICHLLPLVSSRRIGLSNTYTSPFMLRIFSKGMMNCDMGMATAININRHPEKISIDGLPTEIDVTITIKDLYSMLNMPQHPTVDGIIKTTGLMGYLGTICGYNMNQPDELLMLQLKWIYNYKKKLNPAEIFFSVKRNVSDLAVNVTEGVLRKFGLRY